MSEEITPGDIVAVKSNFGERQEALVIGSSYDYAGRQVLQLRMDGHAGYRIQTLDPSNSVIVRRTISYMHPVEKRHRIERVVFW